MIGLFSFLFIISAILGYLLFAPFYLEINSINGLFAIRFHKLASAKLVFKDHSLKIELKIVGWKRHFDLINSVFKRKSKEKTANKPRKGKSKRPSFSIIKALLQSFKVNKCYLNIDTGNMQLNGILYPAFHLVSKYTNRSVGINFQDKTEIILEIQNNCARVIRAFIYSSLKNKNHGKLR